MNQFSVNHVGDASSTKVFGSAGDAIGYAVCAARDWTGSWRCRYIMSDNKIAIDKEIAIVTRNNRGMIEVEFVADNSKSDRAVDKPEQNPYVKPPYCYCTVICQGGNANNPNKTLSCHDFYNEGDAISCAIKKLNSADRTMCASIYDENGRFVIATSNAPGIVSMHFLREEKVENDTKQILLKAAAELEILSAGVSAMWQPSAQKDRRIDSLTKLVGGLRKLAKEPCK